MTDAARHTLNVAALQNDLPVEGWQHFLTSMGDDGTSKFMYDHKDGTLLVVTITAEGREYEIERPVGAVA